MMNKQKEILEALRAEVMITEMSNLSKSITGLPYDIWLDDAGNSRNIPHNSPRLKVDIGDNQKVSVKIDKNPKILAGSTFKKSKEVFDWISDNYDILMKHWNREITLSELMKEIVR